MRDLIVWAAEFGALRLALFFVLTPILGLFVLIFCFMPGEKKPVHKAPEHHAPPPRVGPPFIKGLLMRMAVVARMEPLVFMGLLVVAAMPCVTTFFAFHDPDGTVGVGARVFVCVFFWCIFIICMGGVYGSIPQKELDARLGKRISWSHWTADIFFGLGYGLIMMVFQGLLGALFGGVSGGFKGRGGSSGGGGAGGKW